jgi:hypothetical protein
MRTDLPRRRSGGALSAAIGGLLALSAPACDKGSLPPAPPAAAAASPRRAPPGFLKGQLHAHTSGSGDSDTPPEEAAAWYAAHGFDFVVFTDHNRVTETPSLPTLLVFRGVELTQNLRACEPPPEPHDACLLHVNALFVTSAPFWVHFGSAESKRRTFLYTRAVDRAFALGGVPQLNHPNFQGGAGIDELMALAARGLALVEIANMAVDSNNEGGGRRISTEALWDAALTRGAHVFGTATDDAHHYADAEAVERHGEIAYTGDRGFVVVRAERTEAAVRAAVEGGDFYASTGVFFDRVELGKTVISLDVRPETPPYTFEVISGGHVVHRVLGTSLRFDPREAASGHVGGDAQAPGSAGYARVRVTDASGRRAWTQPVWL